MQSEINRRSFLGRSASVLGATLLPIETYAAIGERSEAEQAPAGVLHSAEIDEFANSYLQTMHGPGMTVALLAGETVRARVYGFSDLAGKLLVRAEQPFWIGSICKSFVGIVAMQLRDEGKLDLHKPVLEMMPDLPFMNEFGPITAHHLLTHTSGLPNWLQLFSIDPSEKAKQAYAPGEKFAYCNLGYDTLGLLIAHLDGRPWPEAVTARIFKALGMMAASAQINDATQARMPVGYHFQYRDRPCAVVDPLVPVGYCVMTNAAGSITATAEDMGKYMRMLVKRGRAPAGRIVSEEGFKLFCTPYAKAPVLSPNASYGYGIGVETIDGRTMLRHTGGADAFASSILVDLDGGVGAFASINSMQGYRPNPVTRYAVDLLYAEKQGKSSPKAAALADPLTVEKPEEYVGSYTSKDGEVLKLTVGHGSLVLSSARGTTRLRPLAPDLFSAADDAVLGGAQAQAPSEFALVFGRGPAGRVTELSYASRWFAGEQFHGAANYARVEEAGRYVGVYTNDSPWMGPLKVVERGGKLWMDGVDELHARGKDRFAVEGGEGTLELEFLSYLGGRAQMLRVGGEVLRRVVVSS